MSQARVRAMADKMRTGQFKWEKAGRIQVAERNGVRIILDGHHRAAAASRAGVKVPIQINTVSDARWRVLMSQVLEAGGVR